MRVIVAVLCVAVISVALAASTTKTSVSSSSDDEVLVTKEFVDSLNKQHGAKWTASAQQGIRIEGASRRSIKALLGTKIARRNAQPPLPRRQFSDRELLEPIPDSFDSASTWPNCPTIAEIRDQSSCGGCWALAAAEAISDRYCVAGVYADLVVSAIHLMSCCWYCGQGCKGGDPSMGWTYWTSIGLPTEKCKPFPFPPCDHYKPQQHFPQCPNTTSSTPACEESCNSTTEKFILYKGSKFYTLLGEEEYQREIMTHGPIEAGIDIYADLTVYKSGVYVQSSSDYMGGHAVKIVGWGTLSGTKYWRVANSWNTDWGDKGYFLIRRGTNECGIEANGYAGIP